jgi:hypothetical protein
MDKRTYYILPFRRSTSGPSLGKILTIFLFLVAVAAIAGMALGS